MSITAQWETNVFHCVLGLKIDLNADPHELCILDAEINGNKAKVCVLAHRQEGKEYKNETIKMNVS